jgi:hypothetical protein
MVLSVEFDVNKHIQHNPLLAFINRPVYPYSRIMYT